MRFKFLLLLLISVFITEFTHGQDRKVAVLDMQYYNAETSSSRTLSSIRLLRTIGVPFDTTSSLTTALQYPVVITATRILQGAFSGAEITDIEAYVGNGGVLITSDMREPALYSLCGISDNISSNERYTITFDTTQTQIKDYLDDSLEVKISLGDSTLGVTFYSRAYPLTTASSFGTYETGECALAVNQFGNGTVYTFGPDFRDITYRNQMNFDVNAHRTYSNGFEPTTDVIMFVVRNIIRSHIPHTVYKYTVPDNYESVFMMTHDIDSKTGIDTMYQFSTFEKNEGISALYNVTTRYFSDSWMSDFYVNSWTEVNQLKDDGHVLASHSVGHFPDFDDENLFPLGSLGNTALNYSPAYSSGVSSGGSVLGELEVSKNTIEDDHNVSVKSFRAGHLAFNDSLITGLEILGYEFNSTQSANDALTSFPYYQIKTKTFDGIESTVLEIPMTISDVFASDPINESNYPQKVDIWTDATLRYHANHSPVVLLIHPNRSWKLTAQQDYLSTLPQNMLIQPFEDFGRFWRKRDSLVFDTELINGDKLMVNIEDQLLTGQQSFVIDFGSLDTVLFQNQNGDPIDFVWMDWDHNSRLYYQETPSGAGIMENKEQFDAFVYPNPTHDMLTIYYPKLSGSYQLAIYDLSGKRIMNQNCLNAKLQLDLRDLQLNTGTYLILLESEGKVIRKKFTYIR